MKKIDNLPIVRLIGSTPLYRIPLECNRYIYIKLEGTNPGGSIKDRTAVGMLKRAEKQGILNENTIIVEPTSGNTGIGLALIGKALGLTVKLTMPESMSYERRKVLAAFGADLILTPAKDGMQGAVDAATAILNENSNAIMLDQFANPGNCDIHEQTTGAEILQDIGENKRITAFVASFGTGGTLTGIGRALKKYDRNTILYGVEPASSPLITGGYAGIHKIQGIGANFLPRNVDLNLIDHFMTVTDDDALRTAKRLVNEFGLFSGLSTGANVFAALEVAKTLPEGSIVVTIQPDRGDKYLSVL